MGFGRSILMAGLGVVLVCAVGCERATLRGEALTAQYASSELGSQMEFWHQLSGRTIVSNDEAYHGLLLFLDGDDAAGDYGGRIEALKGRGLMRGDFDAPAEEAVTRGDLAVGLMRGLGISGGVMSRLFKHSPRYATRELVYLNIYPASSDQQTFTGAQFLGVIALAEDYEALEASVEEGVEAQVEGAVEEGEGAL